MINIEKLSAYREREREREREGGQCSGVDGEMIGKERREPRT